MWLVDEAFREGLRTGSPDCIQDVEVSADSPYLDIEVLSPTPLTAAGSDTTAGLESLRDQFVYRFRQLRRPLRSERSHLLVTCGDLNVRSQTPAGRTPVDDYAALTQGFWQPVIERLQQEVATGFLAVPGHPEGGSPVLGTPGTPALDDYDSRAEAYYRGFLARFIQNHTLPARPAMHPVASVYRVTVTDDAARAPVAYVAVIGFDANDGAYRNEFVRRHGQVSDEQLVQARRLVETLATGVGRNEPLYVLGVVHYPLIAATGGRVLASAESALSRFGNLSRGLECQVPGREPGFAAVCATNQMLVDSTAGMTLNAATFIQHCQDMRMSALIHADVQHGVTAISRAPLTGEQGRSDLSLVACPRFRPGGGTSGMLRARLDLWKGQLEAGFTYDAGYGVEPAPVQVALPLLSASRVDASERRLYTRVHELVTDAKARAQSEAATGTLTAFGEYVDETFLQSGYVPVCPRDGSQLDVPVPRSTRYNFLLLARSREGGGYDLLLSNHTPRKRALVSDWNALLVPAFKDTRGLLEHLLGDVTRQAMDLAEDLDKARLAGDFVRAVTQILGSDSASTDDVWADQLREIAARKFVKISPTDGCFTEYDYHLVVLLPLLQARPAVPDPRPPAAGDGGVPLSAIEKMIAWLETLPTVIRSGEYSPAPGTVSMDALRPGGTGLRWDPAAGFVRHNEDPGQRLPPGAIWFPVAYPDEFSEAGEPASPWQDCPALVARNADVMQWIDGILSRYQDRGVLPQELTMGGLIDAADELQFDGEPHDFNATASALAKVTYMAGFDLEGDPAYEGKTIKRVFLAKKDIPKYRGSRPGICVYDADDHDIAEAEHLSALDAMGFLRPVQRYVLRAGIERAELINSQVLDKLPDKWGFVRVVKGESINPVAVTPPILEQLHPDDWEGADGAREYILCDGNHRVVQRVWMDGRPMPAVAVLGDPNQPYYAHPSSKFEWSITAGNIVPVPPDAANKYWPRTVVVSQLSEKAQQILARQPKELLYRRYFRDLETGFGYMGGQGGRWV